MGDGIRAEDASGGKRTLITWGTIAKPSVSAPKTYSYGWNKKLVKRSSFDTDAGVTLPEYYQRVKDRDKDQWIVVKAAEASAELRSLKFETPKYKPQHPYDTTEDSKSSFKSPGPVAGPFKVRLGDHSVVTYYWYRFPGQPALLNADLTKEEREAMQVKVEKSHRTRTRQLKYLAPPPTGKLANLDPAQIVVPPKGFEIGYDPIAIR